MQHLDEGTIHAWLDGALAGDEAAAVARHVDECRECAAMVAEARGMIAATGRIVSALDDVPAGVIPTPRQARGAQHSLWRRLRFTPARAALAATVLLTVGTLFASRQSETRKDVASAEQVAAPVVARTDSPATPAPRAAATTGAGPAPTDAPKASVTQKRRENGPPVARNSAAESRAKAVVGAATITADAPPTPTIRTAPASAPPAADAAGLPATPRLATKAADTRLSMQRAAVPAPRFDSIASTRDTAGFAAARRKSEKVQQLEAVTMTGAQASQTQQSDPRGCYELQADSAVALRGIPLRFALQLVPGGDGRVVRAVSPEGRLDSVMAGSTWRPAASGRVTVNFAATSEQQPATLQLTTAGSAGQAMIGGRLVNFSVRRMDCRP
jgi:hypothetical protein